MSQLNLGRILFLVGFLMSLTFSISIITASIGGVILILGLIILFKNKDHAIAEYNRMEKAEIQKQKKWAREEKEKMAAGLWGDWDAFTQIRKKEPGHIEFRSSIPLCMITALLIFLAGLDTMMIGFILPEMGWPTGLSAFALTPVIFLAGRGVRINGDDHYVETWLGWIYKPVLTNRIEAVQLSSIEVEKKLGPKSGDPHVGRDVSYPLFLVTRQQKKIRLKNCGTVKKARDLGKEISQLLNIPLENKTNEKAAARSANRTRKKQKTKEAGQPLPARLNLDELQAYVKTHINDLADMHFPDNKGLEWTILGFSKVNDCLCVEAEPGSDEVGYPKFKFIVDQLKTNAVDLVVIYFFDNGEYRKLSARYGYSMKYPKRLE